MEAEWKGGNSTYAKAARGVGEALFGGGLGAIQGAEWRRALEMDGFSVFFYGDLDGVIRWLHVDEDILLHAVCIHDNQNVRLKRNQQFSMHADSCGNRRSRYSLG